MVVSRVVAAALADGLGEDHPERDHPEEDHLEGGRPEGGRPEGGRPKEDRPKEDRLEVAAWALVARERQWEAR